MKKFPAEFTDLLSKKALEAIDNFAAQRIDMRREKLFWFPMVLSRRKALSSIELLDRELSGVLTPVRRRIPKSCIADMRRNYTETLPKTIANQTVDLNDKRGKAAKIARRIGLLKMMRSESLRQVAEKLCGFKLYRDSGCQVICYHDGDYVGPHNDHHPEESHLRNGYVDFHLTLATDAVDQQWLVFERKGFLENMVQVGVQSGISASFLPFWHYTTPLRSKDGQRADAKRWLLLTSFSIKGGHKKMK